MEFPFDLPSLLQTDRSGIAVIDSNRPRGKGLCEVIDRIGYASSSVQGLRTVITTSQRFFTSGSQKLYIKVQGRSVVGFLKIGSKRLFHTSASGKMTEIYPLCLLDFYVHETLQRHGFGKEIYEKMLECEGVSPCKLAIDRPSSKLLYFMRKHYNLSEFMKQSSNFVIFDQFFTRSRSLPPHKAQRPTGDFKAHARNILGQAPFRNIDNITNQYRFSVVAPWG